MTIGEGSTNEAANRAARVSARFSLGVLLAINVFNYIDRYVLAAVESHVRAEFFGPDDPDARLKMGLLATAFLVTYMLTAPIFGWLADRSRRWTIVALGVGLWSLASGGSGLATTFGFLLLMRVLVGVGEAAYGPAAPTLIADLFPVERRGRVLAWFYLAIPVGSALGYMLGGMVAKVSTWHWAFFVTLPPGLILMALAWMRPEPARGLSDRKAGRPAAQLRDYFSLVRNRSYVLGVGGMTAFTFAVGGISFWIPTYFYEYRGVENLAHVNLTFGAITVAAGFAATLTGGWLGDRLTRRWPGAYFLVSAGGMFAGLPFFVGSLYVSFPAAYVLLFAAIFCLFLNTGPANAILANVTTPEVRATGFALSIFLIHALGDAISPPLIGWLTDQTRSAEMPKGDMSLAFLLLSGFMGLSGVLWTLGARHLEQDTAAARE
ncbi:MAG: MFS transporter [Phycisphaerae bacterium]|nr:MFS transporter [Phycisphaerae bacterium]